MSTECARGVCLFVSCQRTEKGGESRCVLREEVQWIQSVGLLLHVEGGILRPSFHTVVGLVLATTFCSHAGLAAVALPLSRRAIVTMQPSRRKPGGLDTECMHVAGICNCNIERCLDVLSVVGGSVDTISSARSAKGKQCMLLVVELTGFCASDMSLSGITFQCRQMPRFAHFHLELSVRIC